MRKIVLVLILIFSVCSGLRAQFQTNRMSTGQNSGMSSLNAPPGASTNNNSQDKENVQTDTTAGFSIGRMVRGFARKDTLTPGYFLFGSAILPGLGQIHNRDYWKLPLVYGGIGAGIYTGISNNIKYQETQDPKYATYRTLGYIGAGLVYWGSLMDGIVSFKTSIRVPVPAKSTIYSALLPGLGQAYNGDYWKIPIWWGGLATCGFFYHQNNIQYQRFKYIYKISTDPKSGYYGGITSSQAEWYKGIYRRYRDYSVLAIVLVYALNIIDANVFAYMSDFDVSDNLATINFQPTIITPISTELASLTNTTPSFGLQMQLNF